MLRQSLSSSSSSPTSLTNSQIDPDSTNSISENNNNNASSCNDNNSKNSANNNDNNNINNCFNNCNTNKPKKVHLKSVKQTKSSKRRRLSSGRSMDPVTTLGSCSASSPPAPVAFMSVESSIVVSPVFDNYSLKADNSTTTLLPTTKYSSLRSKQPGTYNNSNFQNQRTITTSNNKNTNFETQASLLLT
jgi:hypothetical protein